jgi:hypothetical protein
MLAALSAPDKGFWNSAFRPLWLAEFENGYVDLPEVTVDVKDATLEETLNQILTPNRLSYKVVDERSILIVRRVQ